MNTATLADRLETLDKAATPGPWKQCCPSGLGCGGRFVWRDHECMRSVDTHSRGGLPNDPPVDDFDRHDAAPIESVRNALPTIVAALRWNERARALLEHIGSGGNPRFFAEAGAHDELDALLAAHPDAKAGE